MSIEEEEGSQNQHHHQQISFTIENIKNNKSVKNILSKIKELSQQKNNNDLSVTDEVSRYVIDLSNLLESMYLSFGTTWLIPDICNHIVKLFELTNLEIYGYIVYEVLPDKFKNKNKDTYKEFRKKQQLRKINDTFHEMDTAVDYSDYDSDTIIEMRKKMAIHADRLDSVLESRGIDANQVLEQDQLANLKRLEKERFPKSTIGKPIASVEELCQKYTDYKSRHEYMKTQGEKFIKVIQVMVHTFVEEYPPLNSEHCVRLGDTWETYCELFRPFSDRKYRLDHYKATNLALQKQEHTSQKASRDSRVLCANMKDKNGYLLFRSITKEQIEASFEWEINFFRKYMVTRDNLPKLMSEVWAEHAERCLADRSVQLGSHLSHHA